MSATQGYDEGPKLISEEFENKTVLVTGGAGFIGTNLVRKLLSLDTEKVVILDDLSSASLWNLPRDKRVRFIHGSVLEDDKLRNAFELRPRFVFHLAAHFANQNSVDHPEQDLMVNGLGTLKVLRLSHIANVERFVFASSGCSVYGSNAPLPLREEHVSLHLDTPYQITKLLGELYCNYFYDFYALKVAVPRFFNVYGPGEVPGRYRNVIPNFIFWAFNKLPLPITGTGEETRDFTYVGDVVDGVINSAVFKSAIGEPFNLASGRETRVLELAETINKLTGNASGIVFQKKRDWDKSTRRRASIEKAQKVLNYKPSADLETGVRNTISWFKENWENIREDARF
ncbi:MAG TPA: NAD-dependent epimerase/dehydratase family protein [Candidatus Bathyarchaeia archaeon]|nr:NAD-dependent epimerase/dehydratase family protein [Candidatus Bathyarchaeia archaeon]